MNGKRLHREYAISLGLDCKSFVRVECDYLCHVLHYKDSDGYDQRVDFSYEKMMQWLIKNGSNRVFNHIKLGGCDT